MSSRQEQDQTVSNTLEFILKHLDAPLWPRTISTKTSEGRQIVVNSKQEALARFKQSNYTDCRINAFPSYIENRGKIIQPSDFIFIDIDQQQFKDAISLQRGLKGCFGKFRKQLRAYPTVLFTGNGYHVYEPIKGIILEDFVEDFGEFGIERISQKFLKFASIHFSNGKSDPNNNPSFKNCLLRVPNTINSKSGKEIVVVERWNGYRPNINLMVGNFFVYLRNEKLKEDKLREHREKQLGNIHNYVNSNNLILWIETLLNIAIDDYRKHAISLIIAPYLVTIRGFNFKQAHEKISSWLVECNKLRRLDFSVNRKVEEAINNAIMQKVKPMRLETLRIKNKTLYNLILASQKRDYQYMSENKHYFL
jgi:hypothetical protein